MNKKIYFILLALLAWSFNLKAQTAEIESLTAAPGASVSFDVTVADLPTDMGAITLFIGFDSGVLTYTGTTDGTISGYVANNMGSQIGIQWTTTDLVNGEDVNGVFYKSSTLESFRNGYEALLEQDWNVEKVRDSIKKFDKERFKREVEELVINSI